MADLGKEEMRALLKAQSDDIANSLQPYLRDINSHLANLENSIERLMQALNRPVR